MSELDIKIAGLYLSKVESAKARGLTFELSFNHFKRLRLVKRCKVSGVVLTEPVGRGGNPSQTDRTLDRIDSSKGYVPGNVMVVCHAVNNFKSRFEGNPDISVVTPKIAIKILTGLLNNQPVNPPLSEIPQLKIKK